MLAANSNPLVRGFDASLDGAADDAAATRYTVITGERICGWSCDPTSPHYEKDHHMCPAHCSGGEDTTSEEQCERRPVRPRTRCVRVREQCYED